MSRVLPWLEAGLPLVWSSLGAALLYGTLLAALTAVLGRTLLRTAPPALLAALWTVVLCKFLVPVGPELPLSLAGAVQLLWGSTAATATAAAAPDGVAVAAAAPSRWATPWLAAQTALVMAWALIAARRLWRAHRCYRDARRAAALLPTLGSSQQTGGVDLLERAAAAMGTRRLPDVRVTDATTAPHLLGIWAPVLIIPRMLLAEPAALEAALVHELAHLARRDPYVRLLEVIATSLLFFWPVVGWVCRALEEQRERACDAWAVQRGPLGARAYGRMLVALSRAPAAGLALVGPSLLERRIDALLAHRPRPRMGRLGGTALAAWVVIGLSGAPGAEAASTGSGECVIAPGVIATILAAHPEADVDGDGELSRDEVCAHQQRMKRRAVDGFFEHVGGELVSWADPRVDRDGDGVLSSAELERIKLALVASVSAEQLGLPAVSACEQGVMSSPTSELSSQYPTCE